MSSLPAEADLPTTLGDYEFLELTGESPRTLTYRAHQVSIDREVVIEALRPELAADENEVEAFLADVRIKGGIDHPRLGPVYEAVRTDGAVFFAREALSGESLAGMLKRRERLGPRRLLPLLEQVGSILSALEKRGVATAPLEPRHLVVDSRGIVRMVNQAIAGERSDEMSWRDREMVADTFRKLLSATRPGSTRTGKLLAYVAQGGEDAVTWKQIDEAARELAESLGSQPLTRPLERPAPRRERPSPVQVATVVVLVAAVLALAGGVAFVMTRPEKVEVVVRPPVLVPAGSYPGPGGEAVTTKRLWMGATEVTIGEYARFLRALDLIGDERRHVFDHPDQPADKGGHEPDGWEAMLAAAESAGRWQGRDISPAHPVVNVDWWDAYAYANWKDARLPTHDEWFAAWQGGAPPPGGWGPAGDARDDFTGGIRGLAGNVAEWVHDPQVNPAFPMNPKAPVICGGSFEFPRLLRRWVETRAHRAPDVGFRVVFDQEPELR